MEYKNLGVKHEEAELNRNRDARWVHAMQLCRASNSSLSDLIILFICT